MFIQPPGQSGYATPIGPWAPKPRTGVARQVTPAELDAWTRFEDEHVLVIDKPGDLVCHPSKEGPWSSLSGAVKEGKNLAAAHLVFRLDRETSGLVVFAKTAAMARRLQMAAQDHRYGKTYLAILTGTLAAPVRVVAPLGPHVGCPVAVKSTVTVDGTGQPAVSVFTPLERVGAVTLARITTETGRKHQIRAHAEWLGLRLVGDKIYGPDPLLFLEFVEHGWTPRLQEILRLPRQALHCCEIDLRPAGLEYVFDSGLPNDLRAFLDRAAAESVRAGV